MTRTVFTLTGGRTGTAWLADFLSRNMDLKAVHEPLGIHDFGETMPDIRTMRCFNTHGNDAFVRAFWDRKFAAISGDNYAETNHTLGKCGLIENLAESPLVAEATVVILQRDMVKQCASHVIRTDFVNITIPWQWYLVPSYPLKLVSFEPFKSLGLLGHALWYCYEMQTRQAYYRQIYGNRVRFVDADLDVVTKPEGAAQFWAELGGEGECMLPPKKNATNAPIPENLTRAITEITEKISFDPDEIARAAVARGFSFDPSEDREPAPIRRLG
jgi:hypothetical protein